jgi:hypothetical protein
LPFLPVGDNRHCVVDSILPRHFIPTGIAGGRAKADFG